MTNQHSTGSEGDADGDADADGGSSTTSCSGSSHHSRDDLLPNNSKNNSKNNKSNNNNNKTKSRNNNNNNNQTNALVTFCQYVPLRLTVEERTLLQVLESTLYVSEYTDHVDVSMRRHLKVKRILDNILEATHIGTGLAVAGGVLVMNHNNNNNNNNNEDQAENPINDVTLDATASTKSKKKNLTTKKKKKKAAALKGNAIAPNTNNNNSSSTNNTNLASRNPIDNAHLFQTMFEVGRRNKVLNPSSMRDSYGKMMYLLQDAQSPTVAKSLGFSLHKDLCLVGSFLQERHATSLLYDVRLKDAVRVISDRDSNGIKIPRDQITAQVQHQQTLRATLAMEYGTKTTTTAEQEEEESKVSSPSPPTTTTATNNTSTTTTGCTPDDIHRVLESIRDAMAYVDANVKPVQTMLNYLEEYFDPHRPEGEFSLQLSGGSRGYSSSRPTYGFSAFHSSSSSNYSGPTLSHSHATQYTFCWQSLRLWCKIQRHMHQLWVCADTDLLSTSTAYHLHNTGQGLHRVQSCPKVAHVMRTLLNATQQEAGAPWVGLSVIHLGDRDVPNALIFIDKYTQIPRFLHPICTFMNVLLEQNDDDDGNDEEEDNHGENDNNNKTAAAAASSMSVLNQYIVTNFQSRERLMKLVLADYFKHGFDGSGDDGGSCIDGRLTSSWNWTSLLAKKPYYHAMLLLSGFQGFDGDFK